MRDRRLLSIAVVLAAGAAVAATPSPWTALVVGDLEHIHDTLAESHPGAVDSLDAEFRQWLEEGYARGVRQAETVSCLDDALLVLGAYVAGFADGHTQMGAMYAGRWYRWPGFVARWQEGRLVVNEVAEGWEVAVPPVGAEILACAGVPAEQVMREQVLPYRDGRVALEAAWATEAPYLLVRGQGTLVPCPATCTVKADGVERTYDLVWGQIGREAMLARIGRAAQRTSARTGIEEIAPGEFWIRVPTFAPSGEDVGAMHAIVDTLAHLRGAELVVFDVRGNGGGNSSWGDQMVAALYGPELAGWTERRRDVAETYPLWRVSEANRVSLLADLESIRATLGPESPGVRMCEILVAEMATAQAAGRTWVRQPDVDEQAEGVAPPVDGDTPPPNPVTAVVVLLTDPYCGSACLDFADVLLPMPGVIHAGNETGADTAYMDVRGEDLPSGLARFSVARKVYRNRPRGNNQPYVPAFRYEGDLGDTAAVQRWVREIARRGQ